MTEKRADIQGLRGLAVLAVVVFHATSGMLSGGFAGVDIFFVISGYLITQILLRNMESGRFSLADFYRRRVKRLFPALYLMLAVVLVLALAILPPKLLSELVYSQFFTTLFLSNFAFARLSGYFATEAGLKPLLHTWSLGVEEQFYLVFPLLLMAVRRWTGRWLWWLLCGLAVVSLAAGLWLNSVKPESAFYLTASRAFELLIGALCVRWQKLDLPEAWRRSVSLSGLALTLSALVFLNAGLPFPAPWALWPCLGTACLLISPSAWGGRLLSAPPLVFVGDMSYSLYLWHWPLLVFGRLVFGEVWWLSLIAVAAAFGAAWASWRFVEQPFLRGGSRPFMLGAAAMAVSIVACLAVYGGKGWPTRFNAVQRAAFAASDDYNHDRKRCHAERGARTAYSATCVFGPGPAMVAVWGDSHGAELAPALAERGLGVRQITASSCPPSVGYNIAYNPACRPNTADTLLHLERDPTVRTVVLVANFQRYVHDDPMGMLAGLELTALDLQAAGKQVVMVEPTPVYGFDPPSQVGLAMRLGRDPARLGVSSTAR
ncbi:MAG: acyltransferase [Asticcacaulis sp.]|nr:acyltransferase [Asticcacaulis sp.]